MKILTVLLSLLISTGVNAMWAGFSDADLIAKSDLIVFGEITDAKPIRLSDAQAAFVLRISERLKGSGNVAEVLLAMPSAEAPRSSTDISYRVGQKGLWFLRAGPKDGVYLADHPQRFIPAGQTEKITVFRKLLHPASPQPQ